MEPKQIEIGVKTSKKIAACFIVFTPMVYVVWFFLINDIPLSTDSSVWGSFGDFIGGILNPMIALLAFYWLTQSVLIQKTELAATQRILKETENAQKEQAKTQEKKRFEDTFHSLLSQMNSVFDSLNEEVVVQNRPQKSKIGQLHRNIIKNGVGLSPVERAGNMRRDIECNHYFRILYHLLKFIMLNNNYGGEPLDFEDAITRDVSKTEKFYTNIVRSFINQKVTQLLAVNCVTISANDDFYKFKLLVERYALLEHLSFEHEWMHELRNVYELGAFGDHPLVQL
ncbi:MULTISPECIES: putative phage abortive infection protein [Vibrio]|uniref:putative phage abortive infection protein n=1 Tax=Vibrio TaxID=662 RepID=UPI00104FB8D7|nr:MULTISPECIES: putative phage abortive infection protein [Vibrio]TCT75084.1 putative phage abortive infection protein [Vibrio crassostreae]CAK2509081.1 Phage abortive infection protein [Vibrio crassostreae]CAK3078971.1 Phage abortive infection protein [Vibrio crassostreae]